MSVARRRERIEAQPRTLESSETVSAIAPQPQRAVLPTTG